MRGEALRRRSCRLSAALLGLMLLLAGCTYSEREPGLFGRSPAPSSTQSPAPTVSSASVAEIPVLGEAIFRTSGRIQVPVRIAVHAVRRVPGGTVLDWSVTALAAPGTAPGDQLFLELGLVEEFDVSLIDTVQRLVYRPRINRRSGTCLCVPAWLVGQTMVVNTPRLLQTAFPRLPASTRVIEVNIATVPIFSRIPVSPAGEAPSAAGKTDLARPADNQQPAGSGRFERPSGQSFLFRVDSVLAGANFTSLVWTVRAIDHGHGSIGSVHPQIRRSGSGPSLRPRTATVQFATEETVQCLCPTLGNLVGRLHNAGDEVTIVTNYPALARGTTSVDVSFPGMESMPAVPVTAAPEGVFRAGASEPVDTDTWSYLWNRPQAGWSLLRWPTPVPADVGSNRFRSRVDRLIR
jgi:hypothetical protein